LKEKLETMKEDKIEEKIELVHNNLTHGEF
jgi:hypothetical protein